MDYQLILFIVCTVVERTLSHENIVPGPLAFFYDVDGASVQVKWDFRNKEDSKTVQHFSVRYRSKEERRPPARLILVRNPNVTYYIAQEGKKYEQTLDFGGWDRDSNWTKPYPGSTYAIFPNHILITMNNLKQPFGDYQFTFSRTFRRPPLVMLCGTGVLTCLKEQPDVTEKTSLELIRSIHSHQYPVKIGPGCFQVMEYDQKIRKVKIYWQPVHNIGEIMMDVWESGYHKNPLLVDQQTVPASQGWIVTTISLERHHVVIQALNETVLTSAKLSVAFISPQRAHFPELHKRVNWNEKENITTITWKKPENFTVVSYTVFWLDGKAPPNHRINDFVLLSDDIHEFKVKGDGHTSLGISVNTESTYSGILFF